MRTLLLFFISYFASSLASAQYNLLTYDQTVCVTVKAHNIKSQIDNSASAFVLELTHKNNQWLVNEYKPLEETIDEISDINKIITLIIRGNITGKELNKYLIPIKSKIFDQPISNNWPTIDDIVASNKNILIFSDIAGKFDRGYSYKDMIFMCERIRLKQDRIQYKIKGKLINDLAIFSPSSHDLTRPNLLSECLQFWSEFGKVPHFLMCKDDYLSIAKQISDSINNRKRIIGIVNYNGEKLDNVKCKEFPNSRINGRFSFPNKFRTSITPTKDRLFFVPEKVIQFADNKEISREIEAYITPIEKDMLAYLSFESDFKNTVAPEQTNIDKGVKMISNAKIGQSARFSEGSSINILHNQAPEPISQLSFSCWIKPHNLSGDQGLISVDNYTSIKLRDNKIAFTLTDIVDWISNPLKIQPEIWQHIAIVFNDGLITCFLNGERIDTDSIKKSHSLSIGDMQIGNNLWGQSFVGEMDEIRLWSRVLSDAEIKEIYQFKGNIKSSKNIALALLISCLFLASFYAFYKIRKKQKTKKATNHPTTVPISTKSLNIQTQIESIHFFGKFEIFTSNGNHFEAKFFPKIQQLFILISLYTIEKNGISASEINEILWHNVTTEKATNARGTSIQKIRSILKNFETIKIESLGKMWVLVSDCFFDYQLFTVLHVKLYKSIRNKQFDRESFIDFLQIIKNKPFLPGIEAEWLDEIKASVTEKILSILLDAYSFVKDDFNICLDLADALLTFDDLNEEALEIKIRIYKLQGKGNLAKSVYYNFCRKHHEIMAKNYEKPFEDFE